MSKDQDSTRPSMRPPINGWTVVSMKNDWKQIFAFEGVR
jgi:hypothetical protein